MNYMTNAANVTLLEGGSPVLVWAIVIKGPGGEKTIINRGSGLEDMPFVVCLMDELNRPSTTASYDVILLDSLASPTSRVTKTAEEAVNDMLKKTYVDEATAQTLRDLLGHIQNRYQVYLVVVFRNDVNSIKAFIDHTGRNLESVAYGMMGARR